MATEKRLIDAKFAQHIANVELSHDDAGTVQWVLSHTPTVDAVEVVHGTWENEQIGFMYYDATCSACKSHNNSASNYCPHCGAKMDGVSDG